jgi:hypothetical protein
VIVQTLVCVVFLNIYVHIVCWSSLFVHPLAGVTGGSCSLDTSPSDSGLGISSVVLSLSHGIKAIYSVLCGHL